MSSIPSSAMPHAGPTGENKESGETSGSKEEKGGGATISKRAGKLAGQASDYARENPKTAIAAGAALAAGVIAAAIPLVRGRSGSGGAKKTTTAKTSTAKTSAAKTGTAKTTAAKKSGGSRSGGTRSGTGAKKSD